MVLSIEMASFYFLQEIQKTFQDFVQTVSRNAETYHRVDKFAKTLVADGHTETVTIKDEQDILRLDVHISLYSFYNFFPTIQFFYKCRNV